MAFRVLLQCICLVLFGPFVIVLGDVFQEEVEIGTNSPVTGASYFFTGLPAVDEGWHFQLTVYTYETDFESSYEYIDLISANDNSLSSYCDPGVDGGSSYYLCIANVDVTDYVSNTGELTVTTKGTIHVDCCHYNGYVLYMRYKLRWGNESLPLELVSEGGTNLPTVGVGHTFTSLPYGAAGSAFLTVDVIANDYESISEYVNMISANGNTLSSFCDPGVDGYDYYYTCLSSIDVSSLVDSLGELYVATTATSDVNYYPYNGYYYLYVRYTISYILSPTQNPTPLPTAPTGMPTEVPTSPSSLPTSLPSFCPSGIPTSYPSVPTGFPTSYPTGVNFYWEGGTNSPWNGISFTFRGLSPIEVGQVVMLTVDVYATDFSSFSEYVDMISANGNTLSTYCDPGVDSGFYYYSCIYQYDVTNLVDSEGKLEVFTSGTSDINCCHYNGYVLYVFYAVDIMSSPTSYPSALDPTPVPSEPQVTLSFEDGTNAATNGVTHMFTGVPNTVPVKLNVEVYTTDFDSSNEYVDLISANGNTISNFCNPGTQEGGYFFLCVNSYDVSGYISSNGELTVVTTATAEINCCSYNGYYLYVRYTISYDSDYEVLSTEPTSTPSEDYTIVSEVIGTDDVQNGAHWAFWGLPSPSNSEMAQGGALSASAIVLLTVEVYATDFAAADEFVDSIVANQQTLSSFCNPGVDSGGYFYNCLTDYDVSNLVDSSGNLDVTTTATSPVDCCAYNGYYLYVRYTIKYKYPSESIPTPSPAAEWRLEWEGGTDFPDLYGIEHTFTELNEGYSYYLTVEVYETDFSSFFSYVSGIFANGAELLESGSCVPVNCGSLFQDCLFEIDITSHVVWGSSHGYLRVETYGSSVGGACPYLGYSFYARYSVTRKRNDSDEGSSSSATLSIVLGVIFPVGLFCFFLYAWYVYSKKKSPRVGHETENGSSVYSNYNNGNVTSTYPQTIDRSGFQLSQSYVIPSAPPLQYSIAQPQRSYPVAASTNRVDGARDVGAYAMPVNLPRSLIIARINTGDDVSGVPYAGAARIVQE